MKNIVEYPHMNLVEACKAGCPSAQSALYKNYNRAMYRIACRIVQDPMEAEDVLQEAFVRAFNKIHHYQGIATFGAWLKRIVINTSINHRNRKKTDFVALEEAPVEASVPATTDKYEGSWNMDMIKLAIRSLPEGYRKVFNLYQMEGYDHAEIGSILGISEATSKSQYCRAKQKLRKYLLSSEYSQPAIAC